MKTSMSVVMKQVLADPKVRAKMSMGAKRRWAKKDERKRQCTRMKKALNRPEAKAAMSAGAIRRHERGA